MKRSLSNTYYELNYKEQSVWLTDYETFYQGTQLHFFSRNLQKCTRAYHPGVFSVRWWRHPRKERARLVVEQCSCEGRSLVDNLQRNSVDTVNNHHTLRQNQVNSISCTQIVKFEDLAAPQDIWLMIFPLITYLIYNVLRMYREIRSWSLSIANMNCAYPKKHKQFLPLVRRLVV